MEIERSWLPIIFEDENLLVVNKPSGAVVNRAESVKDVTVQDWVEKWVEWDFVEEDEGLVRVFRLRSGIAHRLDKETSGCLLIAKNPKTLKHLLAQFRDRKVKKEYLALVHGRVDPKTGRVCLPIARSRRDREKWEVRYNGKTAETEWIVEEYFEDKKLSLVRLKPVTGRTHQIRVHMAHLGYPLFSDERYLNKSQREIDREHLARHFLHAAVLEFANLDGSLVKVVAPLPEDLHKLILWIK